MWIDNWAGKRPYLLDWLGGLWILFPSHNTRRYLSRSHRCRCATRSPTGIQPWTYRDEMYSRYFMFRDPRRTELLQATPANPQNKVVPIPSPGLMTAPMVAVRWCGAVPTSTTIMHSVTDYRRFLLNGILKPGSPVWTCRGKASRGAVTA